MEMQMSADATFTALAEEISAARAALIERASRSPDHWWDPFELKAVARNGWSAGAMNLALGELLDEGTFELDADLRVRTKA
jgi:hypothetical protein